MEIIDVHSHFISQEYLNLLKKYGKENEDGFPTPSWSINEHLKYMNEVGITKSILSVSSPHFYFGDINETIQLGKHMDEEMACLKRDYPDQIGFASSLPLPDIQASMDAVEYAYDVLHADAIKIPSNAFGLYPGNEKYETLFQVLNERNAIVILHPTAPQSIPKECFTAGPLPLFEFLGDTTRAVIDLIVSGYLEKYPNVKVIVPHCGSFLPNIIDRLTGITDILSKQGIGKSISVEKSMQSLYFDIAGDALPSGMQILKTMVDEDHILFGGDFPYTPKEKIQMKVHQLIESDIQFDLDKIMFKNANDLFHNNH